MAIKQAQLELIQKLAGVPKGFPSPTYDAKRSVRQTEYIKNRVEAKRMGERSARTTSSNDASAAQYLGGKAKDWSNSFSESMQGRKNKMGVKPASKEAQLELIQKLAGVPKGREHLPAPKMESVPPKNRDYAAKNTALQQSKDNKKALLGSKTSSMRQYIDDFIEGGRNNSFGRPINVETNTEWTHIDTAKTAGTLRLLSEAGYSVKQAAEYLGWTEAQVQYIISVTR